MTTGNIIIPIMISALLLCGTVCAQELIPQEGAVYIGEHVDISSVAGGYAKLAYINYYSTDMAPTNDSITYTISLPATRAGYYDFYIDPAIFGQRLGWWYRYNDGFNARQNYRAFKVVAERPPVNQTVPEPVKKAEIIPAPAPELPERHIADFLVAQGDELKIIINTTPATSAWIFGRVNGFYDRKFIDQTTVFTGDETSAMEPGSYTLMVYSAGNNSRFDMRLNGNVIEYFDATQFKVRTINLKVLSPKLVLERVRNIPYIADDVAKYYSLEVQVPRIDITETEAVDVTERTSVIRVVGYTNLAAGSRLRFIMDEKQRTSRTIQQYTYQTTVKSTGNPGSLRYFTTGIPVIWSDMAVGEHELAVYGPHNTRMTVPFWVYTGHEGQQVPEQIIKYIGGNEFRPTPTPETIIKEKVVEKVVTQMIRVEVTPSDEQVRQQQDTVIRGYIRIAGDITGVIVLLIITYLGYRYISGVVRRSRSKP